LYRVHSFGVKHGDLRASNILVADGRVMLLDFAGAITEAPAEALEDEECLLLDNLGMELGWGQVRATRPVIGWLSSCAAPVLRQLWVLWPADPPSFGHWGFPIACRRICCRPSRRLQ